MQAENLLKAVYVLFGYDAQEKVVDVAHAIEDARREGFDDGWERRKEYDDTNGYTIPAPYNEYGLVSDEQPSDHGLERLG